MDTKLVNEEKQPVNGPGWVETVRHYVDSIRFGVVQITVHDGRPVQIERTERVRLDKPPIAH